MSDLLGSFVLKHPLTIEMKIRLSVAYLITLAEYQDVRSIVIHERIYYFKKIFCNCCFWFAYDLQTYD